MMSGDLGRENVVFRQWLWYNESTGVLAQLIRALRWQRRGHEFESRTLHQDLKISEISFVICCRRYFCLALMMYN